MRRDFPEVFHLVFSLQSFSFFGEIFEIWYFEVFGKWRFLRFRTFWEILNPKYSMNPQMPISLNLQILNKSLNFFRVIWDFRDLGNLRFDCLNYLRFDPFPILHFDSLHIFAFWPFSHFCVLTIFTFLCFDLFHIFAFCPFSQFCVLTVFTFLRFDCFHIFAFWSFSHFCALNFFAFAHFYVLTAFTFF